MMKRIPPAGSRLIIAFILTVIVSGGILTYFSISNISNLKELTIKRIAEEQELLANEVLSGFQELLLAEADNIFLTIVSGEGMDPGALKAAEDSDQVFLSFLLGRHGEYLLPWYLDRSSPRNPPVQINSSFLSAFSRGEQSEFRKGNAGEARSHYLASLDQSITSLDSARALNALGRIAVKLKDFQQAFKYDALLCSAFHSSLDDHGFPYSYYAIRRIIDIPDSFANQETREEVSQFLNEMNEGNIPLCIITHELLNELIAWRGDSLTSGASGSAGNWDGQDIHKRLDFIRQCGSRIRDFPSLDQDPEPLIAGKQLYTAGHWGEHNDRLLIVHPRNDSLAGIVLTLDALWDSLMAKSWHTHKNYSHSIEVLRVRGKPVDSNTPVYMAGLSPHFPDYSIRIYLTDSDLVDATVRRRSWIYGIALVLLLGAMSLGVLLILRDLLREKRLQSHRSEFVAQVSHELKTPLTSIHLFTESILLGRVKPPEKQKEYLQIILEETSRLKRMISNILDFSGSESGHSEYQFEEVCMKEVVLSALKELNYWLKELDFSIQKELDEDLLVMGDPDALKQMVLILLDNAIKYSGGSKEIHIRLAGLEQLALLEVRDQGIGIPEKLHDTIFQKFYRMNNPRVQGIGGTGLGLTVLKKIVEAHQGKIEVESQPDQGSTFRIFLTLL